MKNGSIFCRIVPKCVPCNSYAATPNMKRASTSLPQVSSRIIFTHSGGFALFGIANLCLSGLTFTSDYGHNNTTNTVILLSSVGHLRISNCTFQNKVLLTGSNLEYGGAIHVRNSVISLTQNLFQDNSAYHEGALHIHENSRIIMTNNTFLNNFAKNGGGAIYIKNSIAILTESTFQNNLANKGGRLNTKNSILNLKRNTLLSNKAINGELPSRVRDG